MRRRLLPRALATALALSVLALSSTSRADEVPRENALSLPLIGLMVHSLGVQYERRLPRSLSLATSMGIRRSGGEDFDVLELGFGVEGRYWLMGAKLNAMRGPYFGARVEWGTTRVAEHDRVIGTTVRFGESVSFGYRWVFWNRMELTPSVGFGARTELDGRGRLAPWTRPELFRLGTTIGVMF